MLSDKAKFILNLCNKQGEYCTVYEKPPVKKDDYVIITNNWDNQYDKLAKKLGIKYSLGKVDDITLQSAHISLIVDKIEEKWTLKEGLSGIWLSSPEYSKNPNFRKVWNIRIVETNMKYNLVDFLLFLKKM